MSGEMPLSIWDAFRYAFQVSFRTTYNIILFINSRALQIFDFLKACRPGNKNETAPSYTLICCCGLKEGNLIKLKAYKAY